MVMPPNNAKQADVLDGATLLENKNGSAPGQYLDTTVDGHRKIVILLPGPPRELKPLFDDVCSRCWPHRFPRVIWRGGRCAWR